MSYRKRVVFEWETMVPMSLTRAPLMCRLHLRITSKWKPLAPRVQVEYRATSGRWYVLPMMYSPWALQGLAGNFERMRMEASLKRIEGKAK